MTLEDFEKQLAEEREAKRNSEKRREHRSHHDHSDHHRHRRGRHHHHHDGDKDGRDKDWDADGHRSKRRRHEEREEERSRHKHHKHGSRGDNTNDGNTTNAKHGKPEISDLKRDAWMEAPSALDVDIVQRKRQERSPPKQGSLAADYELKVHERELNHHLRDISDDQMAFNHENEANSYDVTYTFGDAGSKSRMTRLRAVYREAQDSGRSTEEVALERYNTLREFDDAREEEIELDRRHNYGRDYIGKEKPSGELSKARKQDVTPQLRNPSRSPKGTKDEVLEGVAAPSTSAGRPDPHAVDQTILNKLRAQLMKAQLKKDPNLSRLQQDYDKATVASAAQDPSVITLSAMDSRMLSSAPRHEVKAVSNRRGAERGQVEENEDMSIDDMVREERRTKGQGYGESKRYAERIAKDGKFDNDIEYMDENASKLARRVHKSEFSLRNMAIDEYQKLSKILDSCPLCHHEDSQSPPVAPVVSLATRTYLTLPTEPELSLFGAMIVPIQHRTNLLEVDDDEWEEIRNFMKSLKRFYHDQGRDVIFYENAAHPHRKPHAALNAVPLPYSQGEIAPAFFKEAFLSTEDEWSQHKKIIDTLAKSKQGLGKLAFRRTLVKEMPYFHVWFELDGGLGHIVEDGQRWPKGDLFAREIIGGMLGSEPDVVRRQGRWHRGHDSRVEQFQKKWGKFDWTKILLDS